MPAHDLAAIRSKVRRLTARNSPNQLTDAQIDEYINSYYVYDLPESMRFLNLMQTLEFEVQAGVDRYDFLSNAYYFVEPPAYIAGTRIDFTTSNDLFFRQWSSIQYIQQIGTGNGTNGPYTGTITGTPFLPSVNTFPVDSIGQKVNVLITANLGNNAGSINAVDNGAGTFNAPSVGTINYVTGAVTVTFPVAIPAGQAIWAEVLPYAPAQPRMVCFYQNQFVFRPVPDKSYIFEINALRAPTDMMTGDNPQMNEWWELLAFGAAQKVLVDNADYETLAAMRPYFEEQLILRQRRTLNQLTSQRSPSIYTLDGQGSFNNLYPYI